MRDDLRREVERQHRVVRDDAALAYLNRLGRELARTTPLGRMPWDFGIVEDESVNALNLPGGLVYVHTGLIERADSLDRFAGVLAHEVAHGASRHGTQLMTRTWGYSVVASLVLGGDPGVKERLLADVVGTGILRDYGRDAEREADRLGVDYMYRAGYDPRGMPAFFRVLLAERKRRPSGLEQFFSSHPVTEERIQLTEAQIAGLPRKDLVRDTPAYRTFRDRVN
jgi:predicted Zn-dependent protease